MRRRRPCWRLVRLAVACAARRLRTEARQIAQFLGLVGHPWWLDGDHTAACDDVGSLRSVGRVLGDPGLRSNEGNKKMQADNVNKVLVFAVCRKTTRTARCQCLQQWVAGGFIRIFFLRLEGHLHGRTKQLFRARQSPPDFGSCQRKQEVGVSGLQCTDAQSNSVFMSRRLPLGGQPCCRCCLLPAAAACLQGAGGKGLWTTGCLLQLSSRGSPCRSPARGC